jgi:hypothetical protein
MKRYTYKKECFHIYIRAGSNVNFYKHIGFTIESRNASKTTLEDANKTPSTFLPSSHTLRLAIYNKYICGGRDLNPRLPAWQAGVLPG